jgi:large repetitive protein
VRGLPFSVRGRCLPAVAAVATLLAVAVGAWGYFTSTGTGTATASVGSINPPSSVTAQQTGANVAASWSAATLNLGGSVQGYRVKRSDGTTVCGSPTLVTGLSCTDSSVPSGTYTYTVTAVYHSWTASATSGSITILTTPTISSSPSNPSANSAPSFGFSGGGGSGYQCRLDGGSFSACSGPKSYSGLSDGSHTFKVHAAQGSSTGPEATYTWTIDTSAPSITVEPSNPSANASPSLSFSHTQSAYTFKCQLDGGGFTTCTSPKSYSGLSDGSHTFKVEAVSTDGATTSVASYTWLVDTTAPSGGSVSYTNGYLTSASVSVTLTQGTDGGSGVNTSSGVLQRSTGTLSNGSCTGFGSFSTIATNPSLSYTDSTVTDGHCYQYQYLVSDNVGNTATYTNTNQAKIDRTAPTNALALGASPSHAFLSGNNLYFKSDTTGSFTLVNTVSDSGSGPVSATFPALSATNWTTHSAETVSTPAGGPYSSSLFKWSATASTPATYTVTSKDNAGNTSAGSTLTFVSDTTAPSGGALSVNGTVASSGGSSSTSSSTSFAIDSRTDYTDGGSGLASSTLTIQSETYSNNACGAPGSGGAYTSPTTISGTTNPATAAGFCYLYTLTGTDNVGNTISIKTTVTVPVAITALVTTNGGTTAGKLEAGDTLTITFSGQVNANTICSGWANGLTTTQSLTGFTLHVTNAKPNDMTVTAEPTGCTTGGVSGTHITLGSNEYVTGSGNKSVDFTPSTIAYNGTAHTLMITLGAGSGNGTLNTVATSALTLTLSGITDTSGGAIVGNPFTSSTTKQF